MCSYESDADWEEESNDDSEHSYEGKGMTFSFESEKEIVSQCLYHTNYLVNEDVKSDLSSNYEDNEMLSPVNVNDFEDFSEVVSSVSTSDNRVPVYSERSRSESLSLFNGYPKHDNEEKIFLDTICMVEVMESESSSDSDFSSYAESLHEDDTSSSFKIYTNALYDQDFNDEQPVFCQNFQRGSLHWVINPLFEVEDVEVSDLENEFNADTLSDCCNQSDCSSSICDSDYLNDSIFCELGDEVLD